MNHLCSAFSDRDKLHVVIDTFNQLFKDQYSVVLEGGYDEPFYLAPKAGLAGKICFREDYISSSLHEIAHWCIAGHARRKLDDYGYWYAPDGRNDEQQAAFESVEAKPQALEWIFSSVVAIDFNISADNLAAAELDLSNFEKSVEMQVREYLDKGLPADARLLLDELIVVFGKVPLDKPPFNLLKDA